MKFKNVVFSCILIFVILISFGIVKNLVNDGIYDKLGLIKKTIELIKEQYVDEVKIKDLTYGAIQGMLRTLDPYSQFLDAESFKELLMDTEGKYSGIGIVIALEKDYPVVIAAIDGTPAYKLGIKANDKIVKIDGVSTENISFLEIVKKIRGENGTKVMISIFRKGQKKSLDFSIIREEIKLESVKSKIIEKNIAYIRITEFCQNTNKDLLKQSKNLFKKELKGIVLDLRDNPGGLLDVSVDVVKNFIGENKLIVYTKGRKKEHIKKYYADQKSKFPNLSLVVLVNNGSASGSEIVAGAIKDWQRGIILGEKTFGKASVQSIFLLKEGNAMKLTVAKYFTPKGKCIHHKGISPDVIVEIPEEVEIKLRSKNIFVEEKTEEKKIEDIQLQRAVDIIKSYDILKKNKYNNEKRGL
ncbi:MAG: S41 family peptidase [bacterium]